MESSENDIKPIFIKEEYNDDFEFVDFVTQSNVTSLVKEEDRSQDINDFDASIKVEEHGVQVFKVDTTEETTAKEIESVFLPEQPFNKSLLCSDCSIAYVDYCTRCSMLLRVLDNIVRKGTKDRAKYTLPVKVLTFDPISGVIFAKQDLPSGVTFGPYEGLQMKGDWFVVRDGKLVCSASPENSNWLRYISYTPTLPLANIVPVQCGQYMLFRSCREILAGEELQAYLAGDLRDSIFKPVVIEQLGDTYACMSCCLGFSTRKHLVWHWKVCPYPRNRIVPYLKMDKRYSSKGKKHLRINAKRKKASSKINVLLHEIASKSKNNSRTVNINDYDTSYYRSGHTSYPDIAPYRVEPVKKSRKRKSEQPTTQPLEQSQTQLPGGRPATQLPAQRPKIKISKFPCDKCNRKFTSKRLLNCHKELMHKVKCDKCHKEFSPQQFAEHTHRKKKKLYKCSYCDYMSEKKCIDFVLHMIHKYDKKESVGAKESSEVSATAVPTK